MSDETRDTQDAAWVGESPVKAPRDAMLGHHAPALGEASGQLEDLPVYARGILKIQVPLRVTLASQRKPIQEIIELGPGSIVKFDKTYDEPLELLVGDRPIATGEVVKVGDKFGLRLGAILAP